ncbi:hypothetical protein WR25_01726 [Diploscapter pachys]|uniref:Anaphase-promoting complex subunit 4 WD40 domain-containing protein n=1 Tax=Diploscapter pachys TaxID=2018661 RepID=A0A2A2LRR5_9BILA|nr:hypothetical protein WR25_01726 [Diploscapter pachys]
MDNENPEEVLKKEDVLEVIELEDATDPAGEEIDEDIEAGDDEDQQSTSNNGMDVEVVDDARFALQAHAQDCFCLAICNDRFIVTGGEDDTAFLFDTTVSESDPVLKIEHKDSVIAVAFNHNNSLLATADMSGKIVITQLNDLKTRAELEECSDLEWIEWHTTSDILFAGDKDGILWMWLIGPSGVAQNKVFASAGLPCTAGSVLSDGRRLLAGYSDGLIRLWCLKDQTSTTMKVDSAVTKIERHHLQPISAVGTQSGAVYLFNTSAPEGTLKRLVCFPPLDGSSSNKNEEDEDVGCCVESMQFSEHFPWLVVGRNDGTFTVYEIDNSSPRSIYRSTQMQAIVKVIWSYKGTAPYFTCGSTDGTVRVFDARDGGLVKELGNGGDSVLDMVVLQKEPLQIMTAGENGMIRLFEIAL